MTGSGGEPGPPLLRRGSPTLAAHLERLLGGALTHTRSPCAHVGVLRDEGLHARLGEQAFLRSPGWRSLRGILEGGFWPVSCVSPPPFPGASLGLPPCPVLVSS